MSGLIIKASGGLLILLVVLGLSIMLAAGTAEYPQGWLYLAVLEVSITMIMLHLYNQGQRVISSGPYALVRYPMYLGSLLMLLFMPIALGSWWGVLGLIPMTLIVSARLLDEEKFLVRNLSDYEEYRQKVRRRLVPYIW